MNKWLGVMLAVVATVSIGVAVRAQVQLHDARASLSSDLSGPPPPASTTPPPAVATARLLDDDADDLPTLQRQVAALQAECNRLKAELAAARAATGAGTNAVPSAKNGAVFGRGR